ncbi:hypothetical protein ASD56_03145 [Microbacterium sp. Root166]|nr:hypothetical protein ASD56_03145 [Microbacterium sp. Root166]
MFWLGVGFLPFTTQVAMWFRARLQADPVVGSMGGKAAAENMTPGQVVLFSIGAIVIGSIILWNVGRSISEDLASSGIQAAPLLLLMIFAGSAGVVGGVVLARLGATTQARGRSWMVPVGIILAIVGLAASISAIGMVLGAAG